ncbi:YciI family protein [Cryobacterium frigoriphilum]|uniref:YciI family protein n=1 Tax=Cryobacterium frigoriphilum TaxID=1259150 RepID=A0A4R8ZYF9_9MICO|nr:YciI family protein [Cryobacterium frigoriphilum]TFD48926.1 YciI family protein [Cryobacterium frigoriphilum]
MQYSLLVMSQEAGDAEVSDEAMEWGRAAFDAYAKSLDAAGVLVSADILQPVAVATTISVRDGALTVQDGPFADTRERLNGTFVVEVPDVDTAIAWAAKCPGAQYGAVEIRPSAIVFRDGAWHSLVSTTATD